MNKKYYAYLILTEDNTLYGGYTDNPEQRFEKHKSGLAAKYTRAHKPVKMVYLREFETKSEAMKEEYRIKHLTRAQKEALIENSELNILSDKSCKYFVVQEKTE